jgi:hypothetical protein
MRKELTILPENYRWVWRKAIGSPARAVQL